MNRAILHMDLDSFFVSVERLKNAKLHGRPLIIGGSSNRGVVASCSYETRKFGVRSAMPMRLALRLCPDAIVLKGDMESYSKYSHLVTDIIADKSPTYEKSSIDEFYVDLTGMDRFHGSYKWATTLRQTIMNETGLPISMAMAANKLVSKIGTGEAKPNGQIEIENGTEREYIAPMPVSKLPGVGENMAPKLKAMGVQTIRTLREIPPKLLEIQFGKHGLSLWEKANALDNSPVEGYHEQKSLSTERTFHEDTTDVHFLRSLMAKLTEGLAFDLRQMQKLTACLTVKIRYSDFNTYTLQKRMPYTANDQVLLQTAQELFLKLYDKRLLVRLIGVRFSNLVQGNHQIHLFEDTQDMVNLCQAMDKIRGKYGMEAVQRAVGVAQASKRTPKNLLRQS